MSGHRRDNLERLEHASRELRSRLAKRFQGNPLKAMVREKVVTGRWLTRFIRVAESHGTRKLATACLSSALSSTAMTATGRKYKAHSTSFWTTL